MRSDDGLWSGKERNQDHYYSKPKSVSKKAGNSQMVGKYIAPDGKEYKNPTEYYRNLDK